MRQLVTQRYVAIEATGLHQNKIMWYFFNQHNITCHCVLTVNPKLKSKTKDTAR